ncbi:uncharacterized protein F4807DRAFT_466433 [Annulohypoxylon truncatum]|uniref:uncharacterized protein n=1 Tax=Annulohypoxylon truncatum TaxID=327061 RepID=UPI0020085141|nr:uncharacterized protein F4807DRAFT_466433 [Annulohypoxylon truncatum]KAI1215151.1 hypothetical protein F4807DRAFT_466433 [Annulohypoxylon truncatum]
MSCFLGTVLNRTTSKKISVFIATTRPDFIRLHDAIDRRQKKLAFDTIKWRFERGSLFKDNDMKRIGGLHITHLLHRSPSDSNLHYNLDATTEGGKKVKDVHVPEDESKQTGSFLLHIPSQIHS